MRTGICPGWAKANGWIWGFAEFAAYIGVCATRLPSGELLILGYSGVSAADAGKFYLRRWNIETGFEKLKSHGFNLEASRLRGKGKYERLMAVLAVGIAWCYAMGIWSLVTDKPIRLIQKLNARRAQSIFTRGRDLPAGISVMS